MVFTNVHSLKRYAFCLPLNIKMSLVKALDFSHFNYCDQVTSDQTVELSDKLSWVKIYCIGFVFNLKRRYHITPFYNQLFILVKLPLKTSLLMLLHAVFYCNSSIYLSERFVIMSYITCRSGRRDESLLSIPIHRMVEQIRSFTVSACPYYNKFLDNKHK